MPRKVSFHGNTLVLNDVAPALKTGNRVRYTIHDWMEGEHTLSGEVVSVRDDGVVRVRIGRRPDGETDIVHELPAEALTLVADVIPLREDGR